MGKNFADVADTVDEQIQSSLGEKKSDGLEKRISAKLSLDNYVDLKRGAAFTGLSMSELLDYAFGVFVQEHGTFFTDPVAARELAKEVWGNK